MTETSISATEANRSFSRILDMVKRGQTVRITSHGRPVAMLVPPVVNGEVERQRRAQALAELERHWATLTPVTVGSWTRDELYERD